MRTDPNSSVKLAANRKHTVTTGQLIIWLEEPGAVYLHEGTAKTLLGTGTYLRREVPPGAEISANKASAVRDTRSAVLTPADGGEVFTNFDKRPGDSSIERYLREQALRKRIRENSEAIERRKADRAYIAAHGLDVKEGNEPPAEPEVDPDPPAAAPAAAPAESPATPPAG